MVTSMVTDSTKKEPPFWRVYAGPAAAGLVIIIWSVAWIWKSDQEGIFSIIETLFSGLAFAGLVWTVLMQRDELQEQREELKLTRDELELTRNVFEEQSRTSKKQGFENSFYQMVAVHNDRSKSFTGAEKSEAGAKAFARLYGEVRGSFRGVEKGAIGPEVLNHYRKLKTEHTNLEYTPYSNNLFNIITMVDKTILVEPHEKIQYYRVLANLLSIGELWLALLEAHERGIQDHLKNVEFFDNLTDLPKKPNPSGPTFISFH